MKCPKCGYITFDFYDACPKCNRDLKEVRDRFILFPFKASTINWLEAEGEEISIPAPDTATGEIIFEESPAQSEEIELETVSLDSLEIGTEKEEEKESEKEIQEEHQEIVLEEEEEIEIEPVDLKLLEEQMEKKEKEKGKDKLKEDAEEKEVELEPIDLESLEIELEEEKDQEK